MSNYPPTPNLHIAELDMQLGFIRQTGLAQNRLLYVVFFVKGGQLNLIKMPYDLYGQYYASARDAENAEMAQCAEIDARLAYKKIAELEKQMQQQQPPNTDEEVHHLWQYCKHLEERIKALELQACGTK